MSWDAVRIPSNLEKRGPENPPSDKAPALFLSDKRGYESKKNSEDQYYHGEKNTSYDNSVCWCLRYHFYLKSLFICMEI